MSTLADVSRGSVRSLERRDRHFFADKFWRVRYDSLAAPDLFDEVANPCTGEFRCATFEKKKMLLLFSFRLSRGRRSHTLTLSHPPPPSLSLSHSHTHFYTIHTVIPLSISSSLIHTHISTLFLHPIAPLSHSLSTRS